MVVTKVNGKRVHLWRRDDDRNSSHTGKKSDQCDHGLNLFGVGFVDTKPWNDNQRIDTLNGKTILLKSRKL